MAFSQCRVGEASNPGPTEFGQWSIGAANPTGLSGKASIINDFVPGIYGVSESHLTAPGIARFRAELAQSGSKFKFTSGAPAPTKKSSILSTGGKHTGVGFLSSFPIRPIVAGWDNELWQTSRIHAAQFLVNQTWITGGVAYGWAFQSESQQVKADTEALLQQLTAQVLIHPGPKFICGDFNQHQQSMLEPKLWESQGWVELQDWAYRRHRIMPSTTCKRTTRKDFLYISPELQACLEASFVHQEIFADHAVLEARFAHLTPPEVIHAWPKAKPITLTDIQQQYLKTAVSNSRAARSTTKRYEDICQQYEAAVEQVFQQTGSRPLDKAQKGRGTVVERIAVSTTLHPVKPSRHGEQQCNIVCPTLRQKQWFVQWRRLTNLRRLLSTPINKPSALQHAYALWRSILRAKGFPPNFRLWWTQQCKGQQVTQSLLPTLLPSSDLIRFVETEFAKKYLDLEAAQKQSKAHEQFQKHQADANQVFRSVRDQGPEPVETLLQTVTTTVDTVVDAGSIIVEDSSKIESSLPILGGAWPVYAHMNEDNQLWFDEEHDLVAGQQITQQQPQGTFEQLFDAFGKEWTARWDKHRDTPIDHWDVLLGFIQEAFPIEPSMACEAITMEQWERELKCKPKHAATGMDGVSVADLRNMPHMLIDQMLKLIDHIELTADWPDQLVHGAVHSLQKVQDACKVSQYRPITILPVVYRLWSSIRCKLLIRHLQRYAPPGIYGNVTGKSATAMWYELQMQIEIAQWEDRPLTGSIADIVKAFNCLPRVPILAAAVQLGVHPRIVRPWTSMLGKLTRHFVIRKSYGPGLQSATGLAEGDGLSVAGMMITNIVMHRYMSLRCPDIHMLSYVDNWEMNAETVEEVQQGMHQLERFCELWDLQLDQNKTVYWSVNANDRKTLRQADRTVIRSCRDLGGHMQFTKQKTNSTLAIKCDNIKKLWPRLNQCRAPLRHKTKVLRCKAWPRVLHSSPGVHVNPHIFTNLRSGAMQGLGLNKSGASSLIQLSWLLFPTHDPECYAIFTSVRHARRFVPIDAVDPYLQNSRDVPERQQMPGPLGVLISRLAAIGWRYDQYGTFHDLNGLPIDVFAGAFQGIASKIALDWQQHVGRQVQQRHGFEGAQDVAPFFVAKSSQKLTDQDRGIVRAALNGTFFTEDFLGKTHAQPEEEWTCPQCGHPDSIQHRYWECEHTQHSRDQIPEEILAFVEQQPPVTKHRGWLTLPPSYVSYQKSLLDIPDSTGDFQYCHQDSFRDAFTDGAGIDPIQPQSRLVAWAWVIGCHETQNFYPMAQGGVPGMLQTVGRAELVAVISVVRYACLNKCKLRVWIDNEYICNKAKLIQASCKEPSILDPMQPDSDLWGVFYTCISAVSNLVTFHKVVSHQQASKLDLIDQWICAGNEQADRHASVALSQLPVEVRTRQQEVSSQIRWYQTASDHLIQHILRVGTAFTQTKKTTSEEVQISGPSDADNATPINTKHVVSMMQDRLPPSFSFTGIHKWFDWFSAVTNIQTQPKWVTWHELLISYQLTTGERGVQCKHVTEGNHRQWEQMNLRSEYDFPEVSRAFGHFCMQIIKKTNPSWKSSMRRPHNWRFQMWCGCIFLHFDATMDAAVQTWLKAHVASSTFCSVKDMAKLPQAADLEVVTTHRRVGLWRFVV